MSEEVPLLVRVKFAFNGKNNDEVIVYEFILLKYVQLSFRKHEIITITQQIDGGWWEGTLNGITGWFPSDYVDILDPNNVVPATNGHQERIVGIVVEMTVHRSQFSSPKYFNR